MKTYSIPSTRYIVSIYLNMISPSKMWLNLKKDNCWFVDAALFAGLKYKKVSLSMVSGEKSQKVCDQISYNFNMLYCVTGTVQS